MFYIVLPSSRWPRGTINMQSIELVAILVAPCDFQNLCWGPIRAPQDPRKGEMFRLRSFDPALVLKTDRLHFCNGLWRPGPSHPAKMQSICPSHGALQICSQSGWRPSTGHPRATSTLQNSFSKKPLNLITTFLELFCPHRRGHETP